MQQFCQYFFVLAPMQFVFNFHSFLKGKEERNLHILSKWFENLTIVPAVEGIGELDRQIHHQKKRVIKGLHTYTENVRMLIMPPLESVKDSNFRLGIQRKFLLSTKFFWLTIFHNSRIVEFLFRIFDKMVNKRSL